MKKTILLLKLICYTVFTITTSTNSKAQTDTLFWFVAPEAGSGGAQFDLPIVFRVSTLGNPSQIVLDIPANGTFTPIVVNLGANSTQTIDLSAYLNLVENRPPDQILNKGIRIRATYPITVYYEVVSSYCNCNPELFSLKGNKALGTKFFTPFQDTFRNGGMWNYSPAPFSAIDIVATEDNTKVTISPTKDIVGHLGGSTFTITLNKGQTYSATATSREGNQHLGGSKVVSDKPIAITIKDDKIGFSFCADLAGDQLIPVDYIGNEYIVMKGFLDLPDRIYMLAVENNTDVYIDGVLVRTLNEGEYFFHRLYNSSVYINSSKNIYVLHITGLECEMGMAIIPPINCTGSLQLGFARASSDNFFLFILVENGGQNNFLLNGNPNAIDVSKFSFVPGTMNQWLFSVQLIDTNKLPPNSSNLLENNTNRFHLGILHETSINGNVANGTKYGYFSDFGHSFINTYAEKPNLCIGDTIKLFGQTDTTANYFWSGPNGFYSTEQNPFILNAAQLHEGFYYFNTSAPLCGSGQDSVFISVSQKPSPPQLTSNSPICVGEDLKIYVVNKPNDSLTVVWYNSDFDWIQDGDTLTINNSTYNDSGNYYAVYKNASGCESDPTVLNFNIGQGLQKPNLVSSSSGNKFCTGDRIMITNTATSAPSDIYEWTGPNGYSSNQHGQIVIDPATSQHQGYYKLTVKKPSGCESTDSIYIEVGNQPDVSNVSLRSNSPVCSSEPLLFYADGLDQDMEYSWNGPQNFSRSNESPAMINKSTSNHAGRYYLTVKKGACVADSALFIDIDIFQSPIADFTFVSEYFELNIERTFSNLSQFAKTYLWDFGDQSATVKNVNPRHTYTEVGIYPVMLIAYSDNQACADTMIKDITVIPEKDKEFFAPGSFSPNGDGLNEIFIITGVGIYDVTFEIYDRWGELLFTSHDGTKIGWDGTYRGNPVPEGIYVYIIKYKNIQNHIKNSKGTIHLMR
jgi:gliding motility-associated-like protein